MPTTFLAEGAPAAIGPYSHGAVCDGMPVFLSGQIALDTAGMFLGGSAAEQTTAVFRNIRAVLAAQGLTLNDVVKTTVYLTNMGDFREMNAVYGSEFGDHRPARTTVEVSRLPKDAIVEIEVIACKR